MTFRIVSYNLLVPVLGDQPHYYIKSEPKFLKADYRWNLIQNQLEQEIVQHENTIICLQELSLPILPKLELFLRRLNYSLFHHLYGKSHNDFMGVGIAIPISMQLNSISYIRIGDYIRSMIKRDEKKTNILTWGWNLYQYVLSKFIEVTHDPWKISMDRNNTLIVLQVVINGKPLCVSTYHMPCLYKQPDTMAIHSSFLKDLVFKIAHGQDIILAGDFNQKPLDTMYQALTEKGYRDIHFPNVNTYDITYQPNTEQVFKSAYREKNRSEPVYTNFAHTQYSPNFCATLDYIFFAGNLTVEKVLELPDQPISESYPDETHPSDHLMIAATFQLS